MYLWKIFAKSSDRSTIFIKGKMTDTRGHFDKEYATIESEFYWFTLPV